MFITRRALVVACLVALSAAMGLASHPAGAAPVGASSNPEGVARARARAASEELAAWVTGQKGQLSLYVGYANSSRELTTVNADRPLNPASNAKILTMATAFKELGPEWRFTTSLCGLAERDSVETLGIVSNGDPTLDRAAMLDLAYQLVQRGFKRVKRIVVDQSAFDDNFTPPAFEQQPNEWASFRAPVSAVAFNGNSVSVWVSPSLPAEAAKVAAFPPSFVDLVVSAKTQQPKDKPAPVEIRSHSERVGLKLWVSGKLSMGAEPVTFLRRIEDPKIFAGYALADTLRSLGVQVATPLAIEPGSCGNQPVLARRLSPPLVTVMHQLGKDSDNFTAEMLVKAIGAHSTSKPGTTVDGIEAIRQFAATVHPLARGTRLINGSGLFDANRVSAEQFAAVLRYMRAEPRLGPEFVASLSVAGRDGTLRKRLEKTSPAIIRAKTGTLKQVVSLSGYLQATESSETLVFSVIVNGIEPSDTAKKKIDAFVERLIATLH